MAPTFKLMGGLGNQLFVYSAALHYAIEFGKIVWVDPQFAAGTQKGGKHHKLSSTLDKLVMDPRVKIAPPHENPKNAALNLLSDVRRKFLSSGGTLLPTHADSGGAGETVEKNSIYVRGYFQTAEFLDSLKREGHWMPPRPKIITSEARELSKRIRNSSGVVLHVRRGDYGQLGDSFGKLGLNYYVKSLERLEHAEGRLGKVFIFTDEVGYVEATMLPQLRKSFNTEIVRPMTSPEQDLYTMAHGSSFVLANSSFSWWAASLNSGRERATVIYPKPWFRASAFSKNLFADSWVPVGANWESDD